VVVPLLNSVLPEAEAWPEFADRLLGSVRDHSDSISADLNGVLENWQMDRVAPMERVLLKLGCAEICYFPEIPPRVTINEYIELAKDYVDDHSPAFINGVLDRLSNSKGKRDFKARQPKRVRGRRKRRAGRAGAAFADAVAAK